ncbi:hypothetical protein ACJX0J_007645, partial [Zea mays]
MIDKHTNIATSLLGHIKESCENDMLSIGAVKNLLSGTSGHFVVSIWVLILPMYDYFYFSGGVIYKFILCVGDISLLLQWQAEGLLTPTIHSIYHSPSILRKGQGLKKLYVNG